MIQEYEFSCNIFDEIELVRNQYPLIQYVTGDKESAIYHFIDSTLDVKNNRIRMFTEDHGLKNLIDPEETINYLETMLGTKHIKQKIK